MQPGWLADLLNQAMSKCMSGQSKTSATSSLARDWLLVEDAAEVCLRKSLLSSDWVI